MKKEVNAGTLLTQERLKKNLKIEEVSTALKISINAIAALEHNNLEYYHSRVNAEGIARIYSDYLRLNSDLITALVRRDYIITVPDGVQENKSINLGTFTTHDTSWWVGVLLVFFAVVFFVFQIYLYLLPPKLRILEPGAKSFKRVEKIRVKGEVDKESEVEVNRVSANVEASGIFFVDAILKRGKNQVVVKVTGANGRTTTKVLEILNE